MYLSVESSSVELCNSFSSIYVILNIECMYLNYLMSSIAFHSSRSVRPCEPTIC